MGRVKPNWSVFILFSFIFFVASAASCGIPWRPRRPYCMYVSRGGRLMPFTRHKAIWTQQGCHDNAAYSHLQLQISWDTEGGNSQIEYANWNWFDNESWGKSLTELIIWIMIIHTNPAFDTHRNITVSSNHWHCFSNQLSLSKPNFCMRVHWHKIKQKEKEKHLKRKWQNTKENGLNLRLKH